MSAKISVFVTCVEVIIYLLIYNLHDCTFKAEKYCLGFSMSLQWFFLLKTCFSGVTEGFQVVRAHHPRKKTAQIKAMFYKESNMHLHQEFIREQT